ncbi:hypothetical protein H6761_00405 [Candidatus Nomurabacteria bacterium]|nr:hypothetical protein [Candidatus Nomurabacteria bacterium]
MFDDVKKNDQSNDQQNQSAGFDLAENNNNNQSIDETKNNQEAGEKIDDMFQDIDPVANKQPVENFVEKPSAVASGKMQPATPNSTFLNNTSDLAIQKNNLNKMLMEEDSKSSLLKKIIIACLGLVLVGLVAWGAYRVFFNSNANNPQDNQNTNTTQEVEQNNTNDNNSLPQNNENQVNNLENDDDSDGLSNSQEDALGTNPLSPDSDDDGLFDKDEVRVYLTDPLSPDSDNDGLFDREEIFTWQTDPNNSDSDGDTYLDGIEVSGGYNPLGEGKIETTENSEQNQITQ